MPAVAIVGAGVTGLSIAFHLAERGVGPVRIYERAGFVLVKEEKHHSFGHDLVGQYWELRL